MKMEKKKTKHKKPQRFTRSYLPTDLCTYLPTYTRALTQPPSVHLEVFFPLKASLLPDQQGLEATLRGNSPYRAPPFIRKCFLLLPQSMAIAKQRGQLMPGTWDGRPTTGRSREPIPKGLSPNKFAVLGQTRPRAEPPARLPQGTGNSERSQLKNVCRELDCLETSTSA